MKDLREKIQNGSQPVIFYELIPPEVHEIKYVEAYIDCAVDLLTSTSIPIDAVNIPEIHADDHADTPRDSWVPKIDAIDFSRKLIASSCNHIKVVLNRGTVYSDWQQQKEWLEKIQHDHSINTLILIGGSHSDIQYPGPSVLEFSDFVHENHENILCGGITIQSRRYKDYEKDEPFRIITKTQHGIEFFTTQIIFETASIKALLKDYAHCCKQHNVLPKRIFLSFAPLSTRKNLEFMRWLGVNIPETVEKELFKTDIGTGWRSTRIAIQILQELLVFLREENIQVPIGLNIEHITRQNFELSLDFINRLGKIYLDFMAGYAKPRNIP